MGSPRSSTSTTPPRTARSPSARASAAEFSHRLCPSFAMRATGSSPVTASRAARLGSTGGDHSAFRQPVPRSQRPGVAVLAPSATRATASSSVRVPSSRTCRWASAHWGRWTWESVNPGRTQRPPRSTRSGLARARSWVPTPPAMRSPAIASARASGSGVAIVLIAPFSRIIARTLSRGPLGARPSYPTGWTSSQRCPRIVGWEWRASGVGSGPRSGAPAPDPSRMSSSCSASTGRVPTGRPTSSFTTRPPPRTSHRRRSSPPSGRSSASTPAGHSVPGSIGSSSTGQSTGRAPARSGASWETSRWGSSRRRLVDRTAPVSDDVVRALATLSPEHRAVVVLRFLLEYTPGEIAGVLELPRGTVNSRLRRALDALRECFDEEHDVNDADLRQKLLSVQPPDELEAERRSWNVVRAAWETREPSPAERRPRRILAGGALRRGRRPRSLRAHAGGRGGRRLDQGRP